MKRNLLFGFLLLVFSSFYGGDADKIIGTYWSPYKDGKISIYKKDGKFYGKSVESKTPELKDAKNPNVALRNKVVLGQDCFFDFVYDADADEYLDGTIYNPLDGNTYSAKMWLEDGKLKLRGYLGISLFGVTKTMELVK